MFEEIIDSFIPTYLRDKIRDRIVDKLYEASTDANWHKLVRSFRSDAEFQEAFEKAIIRAVQRFSALYEDKELVDALTANTRFWDLPGVEIALKEIVTRPSSYLDAERNVVFQSFVGIMPALGMDRVEPAAQFFLHCLAEEVINIPQLAPLYQVQLQRASLEQGRQMAQTLRELQFDQRQWMTALLGKNASVSLLAAQPALPALLAHSSLPGTLHNLPPKYGEFIGREKEMSRLLDGLSSRWPLISIEGFAGIGKTSLALETAYTCLAANEKAVGSIFTAIVWTSAIGRPQQKLWLNDVLDTIARVFGYSYINQQPLVQKIVEIDRALRDQRTMVIIDNFETIEDPQLEDWLQRVPEPSKVVITSRYCHNRLLRVWDIHLKGLEEPEALELVRRHAQRLDLKSIENAHEQVLLPLVRVAQGSPRIIEIAIGYIKRGRLSLSEAVKHLYAASKTVEGLFDYLFTHAWDLMTRDAQLILMVMPFFTESASKEAIGVTSDLVDHRLNVALEQLVELAMLEINDEWAVSNQRYSTHPLTRAFASTKLREDPVFEAEARRRWGQYYVDFAARSIVREKPSYWNVLKNRVYIDIDLEWPNLRNVLAWAVQEKQGHILIEMMLHLVHYMHRRFHYSERVYYSRKAAEAASELQLKEEEAWFRIDALGWVLIEEGRHADAIQEISVGLSMAESMEANASVGLDIKALAKTFLARAFLEQGNVEQASALIAEAITMESSPLIRCRVYAFAGDTAFSRNVNTEAIRFYERATSLSQGQEDPDFEAMARYRLGSAYLANSDLEKAETEFNWLRDVEQQGTNANIYTTYAKCGLARVAFARNDRENAYLFAKSALEELAHSGTSHQLLGQMNVLLSELEKEEDSG